MPASTANLWKASGIVGLGVLICAAAIFVGELDDAPGASLAGILLLLGSIVLGVRVARRRS